MTEFALHDKVAVITMDDGKANSMRPELSLAMLENLERAKAEASSVLLVGRPGRFCAGFDLKIMAEGEDAATHMRELGARMLYRLFTHPQPVVIACTGHALAGGALMLLTGDTRIGTQGDFKVGLNEVAIGLSLPGWGIALIQDRLAKRHWTAAAIQSQIYDPETAVNVGYLDAVCAPDDLFDTAFVKAKELADLPSESYAKVKALMRQEAAQRMASFVTL